MKEKQKLSEEVQLPVQEVENRIDSVIERIDKLSHEVNKFVPVKSKKLKKNVEMKVIKLHDELLQLECRLDYYATILIGNKNRKN
jgi:hypothetical protein